MKFTADNSSTFILFRLTYHGAFLLFSVILLLLIFIFCYFYYILEKTQKELAIANQKFFLL